MRYDAYLSSLLHISTSMFFRLASQKQSLQPNHTISLSMQLHNKLTTSALSPMITCFLFQGSLFSPTFPPFTTASVQLRVPHMKSLGGYTSPQDESW